MDTLLIVAIVVARCTCKHGRSDDWACSAPTICVFNGQLKPAFLFEVFLGLRCNINLNHRLSLLRHSPPDFVLEHRFNYTTEYVRGKAKSATEMIKLYSQVQNKGKSRCTSRDGLDDNRTRPPGKPVREKRERGFPGRIW